MYFEVAFFKDFGNKLTQSCSAIRRQWFGRDSNSSCSFFCFQLEGMKFRKASASLFQIFLLLFSPLLSISDISQESDSCDSKPVTSWQH